MIVVVDYGVGNLSSIYRMLGKVGCDEATVSGDSEAIARADKLILPGVGAFDHGMSCLRQSGTIDALNDAVGRRRIPVLGICLGMQLMCSASEEGLLPGLCWVDAKVRRFSPPPASPLKVPHMGWNTITVVRPTTLIPVAKGEQRFYFVHSYYVDCAHQADIVATAHYGHDFIAAFSCNNIFGVQFHPEKSHRFGMELMKRFVETPC